MIRVAQPVLAGHVAAEVSGGTREPRLANPRGLCACRRLPFYSNTSMTRANPVPGRAMKAIRVFDEFFGRIMADLPRSTSRPRRNRPVKQGHVVLQRRYGAHPPQEVRDCIPLTAAQVAGLFPERDQGRHGLGGDPTAFRRFLEDPPRCMCSSGNRIFWRTAGDSGRRPTRVATPRVDNRVRSKHSHGGPFHLRRRLLTPGFDGQIKSLIESSIQCLRGQIRKASDLVPDPHAQYRL